MTGTFTEDQRAFQEAARRFARERVAPGYMAREREGCAGREPVREMGALGPIGADTARRPPSAWTIGPMPRRSSAAPARPRPVRGVCAAVVPMDASGATAAGAAGDRGGTAADPQRENLVVPIA